ncbi:3',5'-cyclic-nucleotide phosphodiesterase [Mortierella claussenii]|nr:3',5'-cyclic-nucleotide phosphodiesterase [Mortierella claussenii]
MLLLVDVDTELDFTPPHLPGSYSTYQQHQQQPKSVNGHHGAVAESTIKSVQGNGQRHLRATSDSTVARGTHWRGRRPQSRQSQQHGLQSSLCGLDFLETVLQGLAKGTLHHVVPIAVSSTVSQARIMELFNLGVADVLLKPIEEQAARTLFLNAHRYSKYRTAVTIPRYATQKNSLALPSHTRLRNVFLKDQWLSDILISHYCPTPTKMSLRDFPSMSSNAAQERVEDLKLRLLSWDFHPHDLCEDDLMRCVVIVIQEVMKLDGLGDLNIPEHLLHRFVIGLRDSYHRSNPYHNFAHAVDVLQATFYFLCKMGKLPETGHGFPPLPLANGSNRVTQEPESPESPATIPTENASTEEPSPSPLLIQDYLRPEDIFALVVASIGHDVGHPGVNNMFLVNAHTPLAQVYNDRSVLESFHSMALFQVMKKHGFECFDVDSQNRKFMEFRKMVVSTILATDMGLHFDYVGKIKEQTERLRLQNLPGGRVPKPNQASIDEQERLVLCGTLIKCADISNASRPFHVAERWSTVLLQEMCNQADIEKEMAVCSGSQSVPAGSTKSLANDRGMQIDSQLGFIHGFAMPLFSSVKDLIPEMGYCVDFLKINHSIWQERKTEYLKHGGTSVFATLSNRGSHSAAKSQQHSEDEDQSQPIAPTPRKSNANHYHHQGRPKDQTGKQQTGIPGLKDGGNRSSGPRKPHRSSKQQRTADQEKHQINGTELAISAAGKPQASHTRRSVSDSSIHSANGIHGYKVTSDSSATGMSSIPRLSTWTKMGASEVSIDKDGSRAGSGRSRLLSSRVRTSTSATSLSVSVSSSSPVGPKLSPGHSTSPINQQRRQHQQQQQRLSERRGLTVQ